MTPAEPKPFDLATLLAERGAERYDLHAKYLNHQLPRMLHTIGFDKVYERAEGAYFWDSEGADYLDMLAGFGPLRRPPAVGPWAPLAPRRGGWLRFVGVCGSVAGGLSPTPPLPETTGSAPGPRTPFWGCPLWGSVLNRRTG